jgi:hypothetical protein
MVARQSLSPEERDLVKNFNEQKRPRRRQMTKLPLGRKNRKKRPKKRPSGQGSPRGIKNARKRME